MRRKDREISRQDAEQILGEGEYGVLSTVDAEGQPYGVPLSYVYRNDTLYFHCAQEGRKLDNIAINGKVSFCVVGRTSLLPSQFSTEYESAVAFGTASAVTGTERQDALSWLLGKYSPDHLEEGRQYIRKMDKATQVIKIDISELTGKAKR